MTKDSKKKFSPTAPNNGISISKDQSLLKRPTLAYFSCAPGGSSLHEKWQMWKGISEAAQEQGANLLYVAGEEFENFSQSILYKLIDTSHIDGIIIWNSFFGPHSDPGKIEEFIERYRPLPVVSIELPLRNCANLLVDNRQGIRILLTHLIEDHGYKKIAFLNRKGDHSSDERQAAFEEAMAEYDLDPTLVGDLGSLLARGLRPGTDFQAIVAHYDEAAGQAITKLKKMGVRVPEEVAVTGVNDGMEARGSMPPLTTLRLPFRAMGDQAVRTLLEQIRGEKLPKDKIFPIAPILRRSCGCVEPIAERAVTGFIQRPARTRDEDLKSQRDVIAVNIAHGMGNAAEVQAMKWSHAIFDIFTTELDRHKKNGAAPVKSNTYLMGLHTVLQEAIDEGVNVSRWHEALTNLRRDTLPFLCDQDLFVAEDLWQQARVLIGQIAVRSEVNHGLRAARREDVLRSIEAQLLIAFDFQELLNILIQGFSRLELDNLYIVLYENASLDLDGTTHMSSDVPEWGNLILAYENEKNQLSNPEGIRFNTREILPQGWLQREQPSSLLMESLHLGDEKIGYVIFRAEPPEDALYCDVFPALGIQLSSAVKGVLLRQKLQEALQQAEEANQLKSRFLSMVSHELRTPLNLIVGLSEMAMRQKSRGKTSTEVLHKYLEQIYVSGQHLDRLIRDVLDLASSQVGQMNLMNQSFDLLRVLKDAAGMGQQLAEQKKLGFKAEIPDQLPKVWGDKTRIRQILLNLLSNAVKFTAHGEIVFLVSQRENDILIAVKDTGLGIAKDEQEIIFDEFHQTNRTMARGYGGIGLGLAITRRLVEMHGGKIWVESAGAVGSGSTFVFTLPYNEQLAPDETLPIESRESTVLILTHEPGGVNELILHLRRSGFEVEESLLDENEDVLESLIASPPGAVVLDLTPATEQGWAIIKRLKENPSTQDIPVLFFSLMAERETGVVLEMDYLTKPIGTEQLVKALHRHGLRSIGKSDNHSILIVDDDPGILDLHARMVKSELPNCHVITAMGGKLGLDLMRKELPDLVLLDLMMPEVDGFAVMRIMQEDSALRNIPVIVLSAQVLTRNDISRLNQGVAAVLSKGMFSTKEILDRVENVLSRSQRLGSEAQRLVYQAIAFIHEQYKEPISRSEVAKHLCVNEQYLSRCFNKVVGIGPMAYLSRYRIQQAKRLLEKGNLSITQVSMEVGLSSQSYFSRIFQQETGISPSAYLKGQRKP
jgi:signal transduction histidine kinase/DNA-binding LacI/PurR family transcriptional regulator/DNA-binding response OmpR family regulator